MPPCLRFSKYIHHNIIIYLCTIYLYIYLLTSQTIDFTLSTGNSHPPNSDNMAFEEVLCKYVGEFGRYQIIIMAVIIIFVLTDSFDTIEIVYIQATPSFSPKGEW